MSGLKPCPAPWCADNDPDVEVTGYRGMEFVICGNCGCQGPEGRTPADAITAWSTRAEATTGADALVGRLRATFQLIADRGGAWAKEARAALSAIDEGRGG